MGNDVELSIVLPAYREAENLRTLLPALHAALEPLGVAYEIIVVDTEAPVDDTRAVCEASGARWVPRTGGPLYGDAIRTGLARTQGRHVVLMDADGSHDPAFIARLWERRDEADIVIASRYVEGGTTENPAVLIAMSYAVNVVFRVVLRLPVNDVSNSFRLYRGAPLRALALECSNFDIVEEILVKLVAGPASARVIELPTNFARRKAGETKRNLVTFALSYLATLRRLHRFRAQAMRSGDPR